MTENQCVPGSAKSQVSGNTEKVLSDVIRVVSKASASEDGGALAKLEALSSYYSNRQSGPPFAIDPCDFDFKTILSSLLKSSTEQGIHLRSTGVVFKDVSTMGVDATKAFAPTIGDIFRNPLEGRKKNAVRKIIKNVNGVVKPGEMCLVLGRPGAGCSTLLRTIAGETDQFAGVDGIIHYGGIPQSDMMSKYKSDVIYNGEIDTHFPHLTVDQTLRFSIGCKTPNTRVNNSTREQYILANRDLLATIFGLTHTYDTKVGNDFVRGVSGGERKRVSIAEAMSCKASVYCWDNATRGLDASTALEYAQAIRTQTYLTKSVAFVTLYQAGESVYETFDKVLILYEGHQIFFGPSEAAKSYFVNMGFECPSRQATAEFLTAITDPMGRFPRPGFENKVPRSAAEFEEEWIRSNEYQKLIADIAEYESTADDKDTRDQYDLSLGQERRKVHSRYSAGFFIQMQLLSKRALQRIKGDMTFTVTQVVVAIVQALVTGSLFYGVPSETNGSFSRGALIFFMIIFFSLMGLAEISGQFEERPILLKHRSYSLFHPASETLASNLVKFPFKIISVTVFYLISYFLGNLTRDAWRFFLSYLFLILTAQVISCLFQMVAALTPDAASANAISGIFILAIPIYCGFSLQPKSMHPWFKWISYINPARYGFENMLTTEFHGREMDCGNTLVPSGLGYENLGEGEQVCAFAGSEIGQSFVNGDKYLSTQFSYHYTNIWRNFGILIAFLVGFLLVNALATELKSPVAGGGDHLYFKRSKNTANIVSSKSEDVESGSVTIQEGVDLHPHNDNDAVFQGLGSTGTFLWQNVNYSIPLNGSSRTLLDNIQGFVKPGTLTALMGESGAGKTTLLNVLSERVDVGKVTGDFLVNGRPLDASFKRSTGYVQQHDLHTAEMTVRESLQFAARLRRPKSVPDHEKLEYVERIIQVLDMGYYAEAIVGKVGSGLNVEQRKKLSIGIELVAKPSLLLFLDEPTSGLDSQSSWAIVKLLQRLANAGQSILCTIHQPSSSLFETFDRVLLLRKGGQTVYFGDVGQNSEIVISYFERNGARKCEAHENPAEYILEVVGAGATASVKEDWFEIWKSSEEYQLTTREISDLKAQKYEVENMSKAEKEELEKTFAIPYFDQLKYVIKRTGIQYYRDPDYIISKFMLMIIGGLFIGFSFWNVGHSVIGMQNALFSCFFPVIVGAPAINQIQEKAVTSRELYEGRESKSNTFHWSILLLSQFLNEVPYHLLSGAIFFCAYYFPLKIDDSASRAGVYYLTYSIMYQLYYVSFGLFVVYVAPDLPSAAAITGLCVSFMISFSGVVQPMDLMPGFWTFMYKVVPFTYVIQTLVSTLLHGREVTCKADELNYFNPPSGQTCYGFTESYFERTQHGYLLNPNATTDCAYCEYSVGDEFLKTLNIDFSFRWRNFGFLFAYILFNLVSLCVLYYIFRVKGFGFLSRSTKKLQPAEEGVEQDN